MSVNVKQFGAAGDGVTPDHTAIQIALDECASSGGGTVLVPPGRYACGTLRLRSNVHLHLEAGAVIQAIDNPALFPEICKTPYGNLPGQIQALLWADRVDNVAVTGQGIIDGGGLEPIQGNVAAAIKFRPALVFCRDCRNLKFLDVTLRNSSFWTLHLMRCDTVQVRGVTIAAVRGRINTDGIDPDGCRNVIISDCNITGGDDCIVIKSTEGDVCENITVSNCILSTTCAAIKIGTEAIGDIRNVTVTNCIVRDSEVGLALYLKDGSTYENMLFSNLIMEVASAFPLLVDITPRYYRNPAIGRIRNIAMQNLIIRGRGRGLFEGQPTSPIENLTVRDITWEITGDVDFVTERKPVGARRTESAPDAPNTTDVPFQFILRHVRDATLTNLRVIDRRTTPKTERGHVHAVETTNTTVS